MAVVMVLVVVGEFRKRRGKGKEAFNGKTAIVWDVVGLGVGVAGDEEKVRLGKTAAVGIIMAVVVVLRVTG